MEKDDKIKGEGNSYSFGARMYDPRVGKWLSRDPLEHKFPSLSPYNYVGNNPIVFIDEDGKEPSRNQAGTIEEAVQQWKDKGLTTMSEIRDFVATKTDDVMAIRYVYTKDEGWIDLQHYFGVQTFGKIPMDLLEPASGNKIAQHLLLGEGADKSYYSYEDLPSNEFSSQKSHMKYGLVDLQGEELFNSVLEHFESAKATCAENAPNWRQMPFDDQDRDRLPEIKSAKQVWSYGMKEYKSVIEYYTDEEKGELLKSGKYIPQNHSSEPMDLKGFTPAETSLDNKAK